MPPFPSNLHGNIATIPMSLHLPSPKLSFFLLFLLMVSLVADAKYSTITAWFDCPSVSPSPSPSAQASTNTTFRTDLLALLGDLPAAAAPTGFASLSRGPAFVRGLCRGDVAPGDCVACLNTAVQNITSRCSSGELAGAWYAKCFVAYSDTNASTEREESYSQVIYNAGKVSDPHRFENTYSTLMNLLVARAVNGSARMFATGQANYSAAPNGTLYGLVQCWRDRTAADCDRCLRESVQQLPICCWGQQGGVVLGYNCYLRVEIYTYYDLALNAPPPASPKPPSAPPPFTAERHGKKRSRNTLYEVAFPVGTILIIVSVFGAIMHRRRIMDKRSQNVDTQEGITSFSLSVLKTATANFSKENKLGEGGFGEVFKGVMPDGQIIAVKRLSKNSLQGFRELKNELVLAAKLKHRNLVQLLGVCSQGKLLVYEYMPNKSLDTTLFDPERRRLLDWTKRCMIIRGIARGLLYLHEESHLKIIHRDLKPSNVLLDMDMNCKISDFGLARAFGGDQSIDITRRPVGTLGYMSPEYAYCGHVSTKSDMYSFGVIILEIVTGRKNNNSYEDTIFKSLLSYVWERWNMRSMAELVDPSLGENYPENEVFSCIQIGLLCVQENPSDRPDVSKVVLMLNDHSISVPAPSRPAYFFGSHAGNTAVFNTTTRDSGDTTAVKGHQPLRAPISDNEVTISELKPR